MSAMSTLRCFVVLVQVCIGAGLLAGCPQDPMTPADHVDVAAETADDAACVEMASTKAQADACRAKVKAAWDKFHATDGGAR